MMFSVLLPNLLFYGCVNQPPTARFFLGLESEVEEPLQLQVLSLTLRSENMTFDEPWTTAEINSDGAYFIHTNSLTEIGSINLEARQNYIQTFVDVDSIFSNMQSIEDIVEPIATPFSTRHNHQYDVTIQLLIIEQQLFAVDSYVIEETL